MIQYDPLSPGASTNLNAFPIDTNYNKAIYGSKYEKFYGDDDQFESFNNSGSYITAAIAALGNVINYFAQRDLQKKQMQQQKDYFDYTFDKQNVEYWKRAFYDDPSNQMLRFLSAGLNPNLIYGSLGNVGSAAGNVSPGNPSGLTGNIPTAAPYFDTNSMIQSLLSPAQLASQIALNKSQSFKNYKAAGVDEKTAERMSVLTPLEAEKTGHEIEEVMALKNYYEQLWGKTSNENLAFDKYYQFIDQFLDAQLYDLQMSGSLKYSNISLQTWQEEKILKEITTLIPSQARLNNASAQERVAAAYRIYSLTPEEKRKISAEAGISQKDLDWYLNNRIIYPYLNTAVNGAVDYATAGMTRTIRHIN